MFIGVMVKGVVVGKFLFLSCPFCFTNLFSAIKIKAGFLSVFLKFTLFNAISSLDYMS